MPDERFMIHQMKSMKIATRIGAVLMGASLLDKYLRQGWVDWQLFAIMAVMGLIKIGALVYFRKTN